ncbi:hypothetical protein LZ31DRAFT_562797 [Colletotrichum somersetense]|nr:hypothetical protein LZ31DRAFT_562797 [Colletotrichum somersetense]
MAIGCYITCLRDRLAPDSEGIRNAQIRLIYVLELYGTIQNSPSSLIKLQAIIARICDESRVWDKITAAVCCARELRLVHAAPGKHLFFSKDKQYLAQRSVWFLYSLETEYAVHFGIFPMLDHECCSWHPLYGEGYDICSIMYSYSEFLHRVFRYQYNPRALKRSVSAHDRYDRLKARCHELEEWLDSLPAPLNKAHDPIFLETLKHNNQQLRSAFRVFCMYHRAVFFIHCPWITTTAFMDDNSGVAEKIREPCVKRCIESAGSVIKLANSELFWEEELGRDLRSSDTRWGEMGQVLLVSLCFIVHHLLDNDNENRKAVMPYLAIFGGLLGRLSLNGEASLTDYLELVRLVSPS